jgi:hypothetical protein
MSFTAIQKEKELKPENMLQPDVSTNNENKVVHQVSVFPDIITEIETPDTIQPESELNDNKPVKKSKRNRFLRASILTFIISMIFLIWLLTVVNVGYGALIRLILFIFFMEFGWLSILFFIKWLRSESKRKSETNG